MTTFLAQVDQLRATIFAFTLRYVFLDNAPIGDKGILSIDECWNYYAPVYIDKYSKLKFRAEKYPLIRKFPFLKKLLGLRSKEYPPVRRPKLKLRNARHYQDFSRGIADMAQAITENRPSQISADYSLHVNEIVLAIQNALDTSAPYHVTTTFEPVELA